MLLRGTLAGAAGIALAVALTAFGLDPLDRPATAATGTAATAPAPARPPPTAAPSTSPPTPSPVPTGTASAIGWLGDHNSVITCLGGTFVVQDGPGGLFQHYGFGIYDGQRTTWADADGYLPAQVTTFGDQGATVSITEFADRVVLGGAPFVAVYSRVHVANPTDHTITADPGASAGPGAPQCGPRCRAGAPHREPRLRRGVRPLRWHRARGPSAGARRRRRLRSPLRAHAHVLGPAAGHIAQISVPDTALVDAYQSGFITTQLTRSGNELDTGVNGYEMEFSHDVIGILTNLFTQGYDTGAHALLTEARNVVGSGQYVDGLWTYALPWAVYLLKTGDRQFVAQNFATEGPQGAAQPSIEDSAHTIAADRTGPMGTMEATNDIDTQGYWTTDDYEALLGLAAYRYLASALGNTTEAAWATAAVRQPPRCGQHRRSVRRSPATASTTCPARCSSPTRPTAAPTRATPTGPRPSASAAGPGRGTCSVPR